MDDDVNLVEERAIIEKLLLEDEGQTLEFKTSDILSDPVKLAKEMTALANTNGGRILIGVRNDKSLEGMKAKKEHETHIMNIARDRCDPPLIPKFLLVNKPQGDIYVVKILRYSVIPHAVITKEGRVYFIRVGSSIRETTPIELSRLFEQAKREMVKKPRLELLLIDQDGNAVREIHAQPTFIKIKRTKVQVSPDSSFYMIPQLARKIAESASRMQTSIYPFIKKEPSPDLVPIGIEISNVGEAPAHGIRIFLHFPKECELISEYDAIGGLPFLKNHEPSMGGLFVDSEEGEASAWIDTLGNDLTMRNFHKVYVRFPEKEEIHRITAHITQYNFPPEDVEFQIHIMPKIEERTEYEYEETTQEGG